MKYSDSDSVTQHSWWIYLLEANNLIIHVLLISVVTCAEGKACNTEGHIGRRYIITQLWNTRWCCYHVTLHVQSAFWSRLLRLHLSPSLLLLTPLLILTHPHILSPLDPEWRCLCRLMLKVCLRSSGVTSHSDLSVWDASEKEADRERFEIFLNTNQYFVWLMHITPLRASSLKVHLFKVSIKK